MKTQNQTESASLHAHRTARRHRYYCDSRGDSLPCVSESPRERPAHRLPVELQAARPGLHAVQPGLTTKSSSSASNTAMPARAGPGVFIPSSSPLRSTNAPMTATRPPPANTRIPTRITRSSPPTTTFGTGPTMPTAMSSATRGRPPWRTLLLPPARSCSTNAPAFCTAPCLPGAARPCRRCQQQRQCRPTPMRRTALRVSGRTPRYQATVTADRHGATTLDGNNILVGSANFVLADGHAKFLRCSPENGGQGGVVSVGYTVRRSHRALRAARQTQRNGLRCDLLPRMMRRLRRRGSMERGESDLPALRDTQNARDIRMEL